MIPPEIQKLFEFIDYLDKHKANYLPYVPLCIEIADLNVERLNLDPQANYRQKARLDAVQSEICQKIDIISRNIEQPIKSKLVELNIWSNDISASLWNDHYGAIIRFKDGFADEDVAPVRKYKEMYFDFRNETRSDFVLLFSLFNGLDRILKVLFNFFSDTSHDEFDHFEIKPVQVSTIKEAIEHALMNGRSMSFSMPDSSLFPVEQPVRPNDSINIHNEIIMGNINKIDNVSSDRGHISVGNNITSHGNDNIIVSGVSGSDVRIGNGGESNKKATDIWAIVGVFIAVLAFVVAVIVDWEKIVDFFK